MFRYLNHRLMLINTTLKVYTNSHRAALFFTANDLS